MASPQAEAMYRVYRQLREQSHAVTITLEEQRQLVDEEISKLATEPPGISEVNVDVEGLRAVWLIPDGAASDRAMLWFHGGGYMTGSIRSHRKMVGHVAAATACRVLLVEYRLAPEHPYPAAIHDALVAVRWLVAQGFEPSGLALGGDSAGGGLAVATLLKLRSQGASLPAACILFSPWVDMAATGESIRTRASVDAMIDVEALKMGSGVYLGDHHPTDPLASPVYATLEALPPFYVQVGDFEVLLDDSVRLAANASRDGVDVRLDIFPEMQHVFQTAVGTVPEADDAVARVGVWLRPHLGLQPAEAI